MSDPVTIDLRLPEKWVARHFWSWRKRRAFGFVVAFSPQILAIGVELIAGSSRGIAFVLGPFWIGFATLKIPTRKAPSNVS